MLELAYKILILSGIAAVLALLLEIASAYLADYGDSLITLNQEKEITIKGGNNLLFTLQEQGVFIPSACGGRGTCAYCKVTVNEGGGPLLPTETPYLTPEEIKGNVRLSCQVKVRNDLKIVIPEELFLVKEFKIKATRLYDLTPTIKGLDLEIISPEEGITFKPGQYVQLEVPKFKLTKQPEYRAFSIASPKEDRHRVRLMVTRTPDGVVAIYVHDHLKEGEEMVMRGPYGDFYYRDSDRDLLLIATGSGLTPIRAILHHLETERIARKTTLFFGGRRPDELIDYEPIKELEKKLSHFRYVPVLSRTTGQDHWEGEKGRVTDLIARHIQDNPSIDAYICGNPNMVDSCRELL
ncbi:MAG: 2Fe-2S iron-sulfur cluster binding domain-containing protein, partial [Pseudomonadota bacterium]